MQRTLLAVLAVTLLTGACNNNETEPSPIPANATIPTTTGPGGPLPTPGSPDKIEYRATGNCGGNPVQVITQDDVNGTTILPAVQLPYFGTTQSTATNFFVSISASCSVPYSNTGSTGLLQVQIFVNGTVFREDYTQGAGVLSVTASGTWRR